MRDVPRLLHNLLGVIRRLLRRSIRNHLRIARYRRQRIFELVRDSRRQFAQRRQVFLELHPLLQCRQFRQIRQQTNDAINFSFATPYERNGDAQMPRIARRRYVFDFFSAEDSS